MFGVTAREHLSARDKVRTQADGEVSDCAGVR